jgi:hypothetical protein
MPGSAGDEDHGPSYGRVALVHDWFDSYSGAETVVEQLLPLFSRPDLFALLDFLPEKDRCPPNSCLIVFQVCEEFHLFFCSFQSLVTYSIVFNNVRV